MSNPDLDLATQIVARTSGHALGVDVFAGKLKEESAAIPSQSVFCLEREGDVPIDYCDGGATSPQLYQPRVQILVRSNPGDFAGGRTLAHAVYAAIHDHPPAGYFECRAQQSTPLYVNEESNGAHIWSINVKMGIEE